MTFTYWFCRGAAGWFYRLYGRRQVFGAENIPKSGPVIVACNHVSYLDPPLVGSSIKRECAFMARHDLWNKKWLGSLITKLNAFPVNRDAPNKATFRTALNFLERDIILVLFPEGTRSEDGKLQAGQTGVSLIVQKSRAPVIPAAVIGPEKMWPPHQKKIRHVRLKVVFGDPLFFTPDSSREEIIQAVMHAIADLLTANGIPSRALEDGKPDAEPEQKEQGN